MNRITIIVTTIILSFSLSGCLSTLYPFFTESDIVVNNRLLGEWLHDNGSERGYIRFDPIDDARAKELAPGIRKLSHKGYFVTWKDSSGKLGNQAFVFLAHIANNYYFDFYPAERNSNPAVDQAFGDHRVKLHTCYLVRFHDNDRFEMKMFDASFLDELIKKKKIRMHYEELGSWENNKRIITASTSELQEYIKKYSELPEAYSDNNSFVCTKIINY